MSVTDGVDLLQVLSGLRFCPSDAEMLLVEARDLAHACDDAVKRLAGLADELHAIGLDLAAQLA
jgi:hypothetical protein